MKPDEWWKNFGLGMELDASGAFIYNGIKTLDSLDSLNHAVDIFEVLYNLSVGIERLLKVSIILIEHNESVSIEELEKSLITHNTMDLANRVNDHANLNLSGIHREFLALLSKFYKSHRYGRYSLACIPNIDAEKGMFLQFIQKHLGVEVDLGDPYSSVENTDQMKKFIGKVVKKISDPLFSIINDRAHALNIYTYELRSDSKAMKVFYGDRLDFIDENQVKRELLLYLMHPKSCGDHIDMLRSFDCLDLDPALAPSYIKALLNDIHLSYAEGEVEELYTEVDNVGERFEMLGLMDNEYLSYGHE